MCAPYLRRPRRPGSLCSFDGLQRVSYVVVRVVPRPVAAVGVASTRESGPRGRGTAFFDFARAAASVEIRAFRTRRWTARLQTTFPGRANTALPNSAFLARSAKIRRKTNENVVFSSKFNLAFSAI